MANTGYGKWTHRLAADRFGQIGVKGGEGRVVTEHTKLQLPGPHALGRVGNEILCKVSLDAADHVVVLSLPTLTDDSECVILHERSAADSAKEALLHAAVESENGDSWRRL